MHGVRENPVNPVNPVGKDSRDLAFAGEEIYNSEGWVASLPLRLPSGEPTAFGDFDCFANGSRLGSAQLRSGSDSPNQSEFLV